MCASWSWWVPRSSPRLGSRARASARPLLNMHRCCCCCCCCCSCEASKKVEEGGSARALRGGRSRACTRAGDLAPRGPHLKYRREGDWQELAALDSAPSAQTAGAGAHRDPIRAARSGRRASRRPHFEFRPRARRAERAAVWCSPPREVRTQLGLPRTIAASVTCRHVYSHRRF